MGYFSEMHLLFPSAPRDAVIVGKMSPPVRSEAKQSPLFRVFHRVLVEEEEDIVGDLRVSSGILNPCPDI